jgi:nicotinate phosphoribosyltransferase
MTGRAFALATDLYELTMAAAYFVSGVARASSATFELFVRELPAQRRYLVVAGLEQALYYLQDLHFSEEEVSYLRQLSVFQTVPDTFFEYLRQFRFSGEVWAIPEGTPAFQNEPLLRVTAPMAEAQVIETFLLTTINFQTMVASKASRVVEAAQGRSVIDFGSRRAHGSEAALYAARAAYVGGCAGTSNVEAGLRFGIPTSGTMAHSWVMSFDDEVTAFRQYLNAFPASTTLLIDTYDTLAAARTIAAAGLRPQAVRLDSGDLLALSRAVRRTLDEAGLQATQIFASGDLDEWTIAALLQAGAPVDAFGVGTRLATSFDAPALGGVYKLVELEVGHERRGRVKTSTGKATFPGPKQVWRSSDASGQYAGDVIAAGDEPGPPGAEPLLARVMHQGRPVGGAPSLADVRRRSRVLVERLPPAVRALDVGTPYAVRVSDRLDYERRKLVALMAGR